MLCGICNYQFNRSFSWPASSSLVLCEYSWTQIRSVRLITTELVLLVWPDGVLFSKFMALTTLVSHSLMRTYRKILTLQNRGFDTSYDMVGCRGLPWHCRCLPPDLPPVIPEIPNSRPFTNESQLSIPRPAEHGLQNFQTLVFHEPKLRSITRLFRQGHHITFTGFAWQLDIWFGWFKYWGPVDLNQVVLSPWLSYLSHIRGGGGSFGAVTTRVNTRLGPPLLITRPNPTRGRVVTASKYFRTRF